MQRFKLNLSTEQLEDMNFHCTVVTLRGKAGKWFNLIEYWDRIMRFSKEVKGMNVKENWEIHLYEIMPDEMGYYVSLCKVGGELGEGAAWV